MCQSLNTGERDGLLSNMICMAILGISYLIIEEFKMTKNKKVDASTGRFINFLLLGSVVIDFLFGYIIYATLNAMVLEVIIGLLKAEKLVRMVS